MKESQCKAGIIPNAKACVSCILWDNCDRVIKNPLPILPLLIILALFFAGMILFIIFN
jgi:hypothetical protein